MDASASMLIDRPTSEVYDFVMDVRNDARWRTGVVEAAFVGDGQLGVGTRGYDLVEGNGRSARADWEVYEFVPGKLARWNLTSGPIAGTGGYVCEPARNGTRFTLEADVEPTGALRFLGPVFAIVGRRQNRRDVRRLKRTLESDTSQGVSAE